MRKIIIGILLLAVGSVAEAKDTKYIRFDNTIRATYVNKVGSNLEREIAKIKNNSYNTVIVRVYKNKDNKELSDNENNCISGFYFKSRYGCIEKDLLQKVINVTKKYKINVIAEIELGKLDSLTYPTILKSYKYTNKKLIKSDKIDIFNGVNTAVMKSIIRDLSKYAIYGIIIKQNLIQQYNEGISHISNYAYMKGTGDILYENELKNIIATVSDIYSNGSNSETGLKRKQHKINKLLDNDKYRRWIVFKSSYTNKLLYELGEIIHNSKSNTRMKLILSLDGHIYKNRNEGILVYNIYTEELDRNNNIDKILVNVSIPMNYKGREKPILNDFDKVKKNVINKDKYIYNLGGQKPIDDKVFMLYCEYVGISSKNIVTNKNREICLK